MPTEQIAKPTVIILTTTVKNNLESVGGSSNPIINGNVPPITVVRTTGPKTCIVKFLNLF